MATKLFESLIVGPIHSRRLGSSLGINLLPEHGKICSFDCIYCECGWNNERKNDTKLPTSAEVERALEKRAKEIVKEGIKVDSITFSGNGEPTIHPEFAKIIDITLRIRDCYMKAAKVSVLSNASMIWKDDIREALMKIDNPILKIDSTIEDYMLCINRPAESYSLSRTIENLKKFEGNFILQTMFLRGKAEHPVTKEIIEIDCTNSAHVQKWRELVKELKPRQIMIYSLDRDTPSDQISKVTPQEMAQIAQPLVEQGFKVKVNGEDL